MSTRSPAAALRQKSRDLPARLLRRSLLLAALLAVASGVFTKRPIYSIIMLSGAAISIVSFMMTVKLADRILKTGKGKFFFFLSEFGKIVAILLFFMLVSPASAPAVAFFIIGVSIVILAVIGEGLRQLWRVWVGHGT